MTRTANGTGNSKIHDNLNKWLRCGAIWCAVFILVVSATSFVKAATFTVTTTNDNGDNVSPTAGSLRAAIISANATAAADIINFTGAGIGTISPTTSLPDIIQPLVINGYTGTGAMAATSSTPAQLTVEISGANAGNSGIGLQFSAATCNTTNCRILGLVINRFGEAGIRIDSGSVGVFGNFIGTNLGGTSNLCGTPVVLCGNVNRGVLIVGSAGSAIGNSTIANRNIISGNSGTGISITGGGSATVVGNFIGTDKNGTVDVGNTQDGVRIVDSSNSTIGGANSGSRNVISGNDGNGVAIIQSSNVTIAAGNVISSNFIGVDVTGNATTISGGFQTSPVGNSGSGVLINAGGNRVGGNRTTSLTLSTCVNECNVIAGNRANGVSLGSNFAIGNTVSGNNIGVGITDSNANGNSIGNRDNGIQISNLASRNTIGGTSVAPGTCSSACNVIANNGDPSATSARAGIYADDTASTRNSIRRNSVFMNNGLGIDLGAPGANANDANDPDGGVNNLQNFPTLTAASANGTITGTFNSLPNTIFVFDFYRNDTADAQSEARTFIGSVNATTNGSGNAVINYGATQTLAAGQFVTATATNIQSSNGDTSEISPAQIVAAATGQAPSGLESDVILRPNGDGMIDSTDVNQVQRFQIMLDQPFQSNEFQRADSAPANTRGDGVINSTDTNQAQRYQIGLDARQSAGGSNAPGSPRSIIDWSGDELSVAESLAAPRELSVQSTTGSANQSVTVNLLVDTFGDESGYGFTLTYNNAILLNPTVVVGIAGSSRLCNLDNPGQIICSVNNFPDNNPASQSSQIGEIPAGNDLILVRITFMVAMNAPTGATPLTITSVDATNDISQPLTITPQSGTVTITVPTAAPASVGGRLKTAGGAAIRGASVALFDTQSGETIYATTDANGAYLFEGVAVGSDYIVTPLAFGFSFNPLSKYFSLTEDLTTVDFTGVRNRKYRRF